MGLTKVTAKISHSHNAGIVWIGLMMLLAVGRTGMATDYYSLVTNANPAAYYRLNEPSGTNAADETTNARDGLYCSTNVITFGRSGALAGDTNKAVAFSGASSRIEIPAAAQLVHDTSDFTKCLPESRMPSG